MPPPARPLRDTLVAALHALPAPSPKTLDGGTLLRLRTCAALGGALARVRATAHTDADVQRILLAALLYVYDSLTHCAAALTEARWYWEQVAAVPWRGALCWLQTFPQRVAYGIAHRGLRPTLASVHDVRIRARKNASALAFNYDAKAYQLGALAMAYHAHGNDPLALAQAAARALYAPSALSTTTLIEAVSSVLEGIERHEIQLAAALRPTRHGVPPWLLRVWPLLVAYPLASIIITRYLTTHWDTLRAQVRNLGETLQGLLVHWVYQPARHLLDTLRAGRAERRMIISRDSLAADQQSLERMVAAFGTDKLRLAGAELEAEVQRVHLGDLTGVMERYEDDIRTPLRSLLGGSLVRTVLIQVQKAKVDLEVALSGIDWLLRSQELLIGFVGLAPALALVYLLYAALARVARGLIYGRASPHAQQSLQGARIEAWEALRHVDALVSSARAVPPAQAYGRLLLALGTLRTAFATLIPRAARSRAIAAHLTTEMEHDLCRLELAGQSAVLDQSADAWTYRQTTVAQMWRSWSWLLAMNRLAH